MNPALYMALNTPFDSGAAALALLLHRLGLQASESKFLYCNGKLRLESVDILGIARHFPVRAREFRLYAQQLVAAPLPALGRLRDGDWVVLLQTAGDHVVIQDPNASAPTRVSLAEYDRMADGCVITMVPARGIAEDVATALESLGPEVVRSFVRRLRRRH